VINFLIVIAPLLFKWNLIFTIAGCATLLAEKLKPRSPFSNSSKQTLVRVFLLAILIAPVTSLIASHYIEPSNIFDPPVQIAANSSINKAGPSNFVAVVSAHSLSAVPAERQTWALLIGAFSLTLLTVFSMFFRISSFLSDKRKLRALISSAYPIRSLGRVKIQVSEKISVPFAARDRGFAHVVLPQNLVAQPTSLRIAIQHELQHHRQNDLQWNMVLEATRAIAGWNPLVRKWLGRIEELDELACDENLLGRGRIDVKRYATCLFEAALALHTTGESARLAGTARMATSPKFLRRRIEMTLLTKTRKKNGFLTTIAIVATTLVTTATAWTSEGLIKDRRISQSQAESYARKAQLKSGIPIVINARVLKSLNYITGSPRTRMYMRNVLRRYRTYQPMIEAKLIQANMPPELIAMPAFESGYQNVDGVTSAGLWQFVPETAKRYGLQVDDMKDERVNAAKETDAAIAYLTHLQSIFPTEWNLSLLSYNMGENNVLKLISTTGERDVFKLADQGQLTSDENANYVPKFMAALIIMNNPSLVNE
jgi:membrane-bound lytic murein transglycosylase D